MSRDLRRVGSLGAVAVFLIVGLWQQRAGGDGDILRDLVPSALGAWAVAALTFGIARRTVRDEARAYLLALLALSWVAFAASFGVWGLRLIGPTFIGPMGVAVLWTVLVAGMGALLVAARGSAERIVEALEVGSLVLVLFAIPKLIPSTRSLRGAPAGWTDTRSAAQPDVYVLILDMHTSGAWMSEAYGLDSRPFEDSLRALGFVVPRASRANYAHTQLSLPSLFSGRLLQDDSVFAATPVADLTSLVAESPLWRDVRAKGYRLVTFRSTYAATRALRVADLEIAPVASVPTPWAQTLRLHSVLGALPQRRCEGPECPQEIQTPFPVEPATALEAKLRLVQTLPDSAGPIWAFMHLLAPHEPFLYDANCAHQTPWWPMDPQAAGVDERVRTAYRDQVRCVDSLVLDAVSGLIRRSPTPPVIVITGDHGFARVGVDPMRGITQEFADLTPARLAERMSVFTALRMPGADTLFGDEMSLVEVMPVLRNALWGDSLPVLRDAPSFWSPYQRLKDFAEVPRSAFQMRSADSTR